MPCIQHRGSPKAQTWVLVNQPFVKDKEKGFLFSSGLGYVFDAMMRDAGFTDFYIISRQPDLEHQEAYENVLGLINHYKPPIIIPLEACGAHYLPELAVKRQKKDYNPDVDSEISKYCGSLLTSSLITHPHYCVPTYGPQTIVQQWKERDIVVSFDLQKAKLELDFFTKNGFLNPLPARECKTSFNCFDELRTTLLEFFQYELISNDIETIYPREKSVWKGLHPGYPVTIGLANSRNFGISFELFGWSASESRELWRVLNKLFIKTQQLGQNFFNFDLNFYKMLGFEIDEKRIVDTMMRHAILWPELPHKLQFLGRQYTRQPYWKDEGAGWGVGNMDNLKFYNCLDVCCTMEIYELQEEEFDERPHLK